MNKISTRSSKREDTASSVSPPPEVPTPSSTMPSSQKWKMVSWAAKIIGLFFSLLFAVEFVYETKRWPNSPATYLASAKDHFLNACERAGRFVAWLSSYLDWIELKVLWDTTINVFGPFLELMLGPLRFVKGYVLAAYEYDHRILIVVGSILPLIALEEVLRRRTTFFSRVQRWYISWRDTEWPVPTPTPFWFAALGVALFFLYVFFWFSPVGYHLLFQHGDALPAFLKQ